MTQAYIVSTLPPPAGSRMGQAVPGRQHPSIPSGSLWGLSACNSWPWANTRLSGLLAKKKKKITELTAHFTF